MSDDALDFINATGLSIDAINELYNGYERLQKAGIQITKEQYRDRMEDMMILMEDDLSNFESVIRSSFKGIVLEGEEFYDE